MLSTETALCGELCTDSTEIALCGVNELEGSLTEGRALSTIAGVARMRSTEPGSVPLSKLFAIAVEPRALSSARCLSQGGSTGQVGPEDVPGLLASIPDATLKPVRPTAEVEGSPPRVGPGPSSSRPCCICRVRSQRVSPKSLRRISCVLGHRTL